MMLGFHDLPHAAQAGRGAAEAGNRGGTERSGGCRPSDGRQPPTAQSRRRTNARGRRTPTRVQAPCSAPCPAARAPTRGHVPRHGGRGGHARRGCVRPGPFARTRVPMAGSLGYAWLPGSTGGPQEGGRKNGHAEHWPEAASYSSDQSSPVRSSPGQSSAQSDPVQSSPVQPGPLESSPVQSSPPQASPVQSNPIHPSPVRPGPGADAREEAEAQGPMRSAEPPPSPRHAPAPRRRATQRATALLWGRLLAVPWSVASLIPLSPQLRCQSGCFRV